MKINIMALGGLNENGKNLYIVSINDKLLIFDCGMKYAPDKMYGVDYIIPDFSYLIENKDKIIGLFITHPHRENMGALTDLIKAFAFWWLYLETVNPPCEFTGGIFAFWNGTE